MNSFNSTNTHDFRAKRKCFSTTGCIIFFLLMSHASCRPSEADNSPTYNDGDYTDVDDIEWENLSNVETTTKGHPIIYYKEDIVSEDYDPNKDNKTSSNELETEIVSSQQLRRKYKEISRHNRTDTNYRYLKPENVYFDVYPLEDVALKEDDEKFKDDDIRVEVISLTDDHSELSSDIKRAFGKTPKKYTRHHRHRRDVKGTENHNLRHKRNYSNTFYRNCLPQYYGVVQNPHRHIFKHTIRSKYINVPVPKNNPKNQHKIQNPTQIGTRFDGDSTTENMPVWDTYPIPTTTKRTRTRIPLPPIIHSGDEDFIPQNSPGPSMFVSTTKAPLFPIGALPIAGRPQFSLPSTAAPSILRLPTTTPPPKNTRQISKCVWAIVSCCNRDKNIRYQCFEREGCSGAFWDFNPCADEIHQSAVEASRQFFENTS